MGPKSTLRLMRTLGPSLASLAQSSWSLLVMALVMGPLLGRIASMVVIFSLVTKITQTPLHQHVTRGNDYLLLEKRVCLNSYFNTVYNSCLFISLINLHFMQISHSTFFLQTHNSFQSSFFFLTLYLFTCCSLHF